LFLRTSVYRSTRARSRFVVPLLVVILTTLPLTHDVFALQNAVVGAVSTVGAVRLRGVPVSSEGTLFDGDRIETAGEAYARVQLTDGPRFELGTDTDIRVSRDESPVSIAMNSGAMAFSAPPSSLPVTVAVESFRITVPAGAAAEVAFVAPNRLSVMAIAEALTVTEAFRQETEPVAEGEQVIIDLDAPVEGVEPRPTPEPGSPDSDSGEGSSAKWVIIGAGAGAGAGVGVFLAKKNKDSASPN